MRSRNDVQTAVRMPGELYERLQEAAKSNGDIPLGEEIRRRLAASLDNAPVASADTLLAQIGGTLPKMVRDFFGDWRTDPGAHAVLVKAVERCLAGVKPEGEPVLKPTPAAPGPLRNPASIDAAADMLAVASIVW